MRTGSLFAFAWRVASRVPGSVLRGATVLVADVTWWRHGKSVRQLEHNLERVRPGLSPRALRRLSRRGMRSYMRYYGETFSLSSWSHDQLQARVRTVGDDSVRAELAAGRRVVMALSHQGNWDLAGAWATVYLAPVTTVAERLEPEELFQEFLSFREGLGMRILALSGGGDVFRELLRVVGHSEGPGVVPLLADRDLTHRGLEVDMFGHRARVAVGPAALAVATGAPLYVAGISYERLTGARRRAAGGPWGIVVDFRPIDTAAASGTQRERVAEVTQAWVDELAAMISVHPEDWHMLQKVFVDDLDQDRYRASVAGPVDAAPVDGGGES